MSFARRLGHSVLSRLEMKRLAVAVAIFSLFGCSGDDDLGKDAGQDVVVVDPTTPDAANDAADATLDVASDVTDASDASDAPILTNPTSIEIQAVRVAAETALDGGVANLPIDDATVTYVKALVGNDPAGFFVQAELTGPAIFVAVDPQTLTPSPTPGDQVSFVVTGAHVVSGAHSVTAITTFTRSAQNIALAPLLQDVSGAADVVSNIDGYESEYVTFGATVKSRFQPADTGFVEAQVETTALTGNQALNLRLRVPSGVKTAIGVDNDCTVTLVGIMDRLGGVAQPSGWVAGDFTNTLCNPPKVKTASASSVTSIVVTFDRDIDGASLASNGSQFTFDNGLTASAAQLTSSAQITVTTASQTQNTTYHVTVDSSLTDVLGKGIDTNANQATFTSFNTVAALQLNELNPEHHGQPQSRRAARAHVGQHQRHHARARHREQDRSRDDAEPRGHARRFHRRAFGRDHRVHRDDDEGRLHRHELLLGRVGRQRRHDRHHVFGPRDRRARAEQRRDSRHRAVLSRHRSRVVFRRRDVDSRSRRVAARGLQRQSVQHEHAGGDGVRFVGKLRLVSDGQQRRAQSERRHELRG